ncbi:hypothetical protein A2U01_0067771, partial [Trifolium medium]|nr:hypothetical protein [Trifolium medium]
MCDKAKECDDDLYYYHYLVKEPNIVAVIVTIFGPRLPRCGYGTGTRYEY